MTSELAKQLKDAGFPQKERVIKTSSGKEYCYEPTLSELIEACGDRFSTLRLNPVEYRSRGDWSAMYWLLNPNGTINYSNLSIVEGKTPEEAVAKLYLALAADKGGEDA